MQAIHSFRSLLFAGIFIGLLIFAQPVTASHLGHNLLWRTDYSTRWLNEPLKTYSANWNATHMDMVNIGSSANTSVLIAMKRQNPNIKVLFYGLDFNMIASDSGRHNDIKNWLTGNGYNIEDAFLHFSEDTTLQFKKSDGTIQQVTIPGCSLATRSEACRVQYFAWTDTRWLFNPKDTGLRAYQAKRLSENLMKAYDDPATPEIENYTYDGVMLDEHSPGLTFMGGWSATSIISGGTILEYGMRADASSLDSIYNTDVAGLLAAEKAFVGPNKFIIPNMADYRDALAAERADAAKGDFKEFMLSKITPDPSASLMVWDYVYGRTANQASTILSTFSTPETDPSISTYSKGNFYSPLDRARIMILANYYMAKDAANQFVYLEMWGNLNRLVDDGKTEMIYPKAVDINVGSPLGNYVQAQSGNSPAQCSGVTKTYRVYRREFSNAFVFFRPQDAWDCTTYDDTTAVSLTLPQALYLLHEDGTLGPPMTTLNLRNAEAVILIKDPNLTGIIPDTTPPSAPTNLQTTVVSSFQIDLSWNISTDDVGVMGYHIYRGGALIATTATNSYSDNSLVPLTTYTYTVSAYDKSGNESFLSNPASATTYEADTSPPSTPKDIHATVVSFSKIDLSWMPSTDNIAVVGYKVYRDGILIGMTQENRYSDFGLNPSTTYTYTVSAYDTSGNVSALSSPVSITTALPPPTIINSVQTGNVAIPEGGQSVTVSINPVDTAKAFLVFGTSFDDSNPAFSQISGQITDATTLTFQRTNGVNAPAVTVKWHIAEFISGVSVQRGSTPMNSTTVNVTLSPVITTKAFVVITYRNSGSMYDANDFVKAKTTSQINLQLTTHTAPSGGIVEWQVIEFINAEVQTGDLSFAAEENIKTAMINGVDRAKSWLIYTYKTEAGTTTNMGQKLVHGVITDSSALTFDRDQNGQRIDLTWYLVEFTDGTTVQQGTENFGTGETQKIIPIASVDPSKSIAAGGYFMRGGKSSYNGDDNPGVGWMTLDLTSGANLQIDRGTTHNSTAEIGWFVVAFSAATGPPAAPSGLSVIDVDEDNGGALALAWTVSSSPDVTQQHIYRGTIAGGPYTQAATITSNTTTGYTDTGLDKKTAYYYMIRAYNGTTESVGSNEASAVPLDNIDPAPPSGLSALAVPGDNGGAIVLTWTPSPSEDVIKQRIFKGATTGGPYSLVTVINNNTTGAYTDTGLIGGTTYYYVVRAYDGINKSANSNEASVISLDNIDPAPPSGLIALDVPEDNGGAIVLTWKPSPSTDVIRQRIFRGMTPGGPYSLVTVIHNNTISTYTDASLTNGVPYYYVVRAYDGVNSSAKSNEGSAVPEDNASPDAPTLLAAFDVSGDNGGAVELSWTPSISPDVVEQRVYRSVVADGPYNLIETMTNNTTGTYTDTDLTNGTMYYYVVRAYDGAYESANSNEAIAVPLDNTSPLISEVASTIDSTIATITWTTDELSDSQVEYGTTPAYGNSSTLNTALLTNHSVYLSGLSPLTLYYYRVKSRDSSGNLAVSPYFTLMTGPPSDLNSFQSGSVVIPGGSQSITVPITSVDTTKAFLVFGVSFNDPNPGFSQISGQIINPTALTFQRYSGSGAPAVTVKWYVAEFIDGVYVQRGSVTMDSVSKKVQLKEIDPTRSIPIITYRAPGTHYTADHFVRAKIDKNTTLKLMMDAPDSLGVVEWQVVEFKNAKVQSGDLSFTAEDSIKTAAINGVDTGKSWLLYTYQTASGTTANIGQKLVRGVITDPTTLTFDRVNTGQDIDLTWYLIEFTDGTTVQHGSQSFGTTETQRNVQIQSINPLKSFAVGGYFMRGGKSSYSSDDNPGVGWMTLDLTSSTNLQITRGIAGNSTADIGWFVIRFP